ncbi:uncharacterized protein FIBRA_08807 [Fibroporia radiculosa]|uniref:DUF6534 domain-containing protein n=1 Tax=Fibroporia radiculosa TaxID=599839 RepID=J4H5D2_9APHY|nr:uncharacterized protein FIBRA_08807 [Fibroporia radiculosa]CCM06534.1 predicted protein [Fibroporia radiculosa]
MTTIWKLLARKWYKLPLIIAMVILALISLGCGFATAYECFTDTQLPRVLQNAVVVAMTQPMASSTADICIMITLIWTLHKEKTDFKQTNGIIQKITIYVINRGILTAMLQIAHAISYVAANKGDLYWAIFHYPSSHVYVNSVLAILNARDYIRNGGQVIDVKHFSLKSISKEHSIRRPHRMEVLLSVEEITDVIMNDLDEDRRLNARNAIVLLLTISI